MNVVVPEDSRRDKYILKPLFERLFRSLGKASAHIRICEDPVLGGVVEALKSANLSDIVERYGGMADCFILCVDRDGEIGRRERLDQIEAEFGGQRFLAENAWEELETWVLAGLELPPSGVGPRSEPKYRSRRGISTSSLDVEDLEIFPTAVAKR